MDFWYVLGIEPTNDIEEIKTAYKKQLKLNHPEDNPEGFKNLRAALDSAMDYVANGDKVKESRYDDSPIGIVLQRVEKLYNNYWARINPKNWEQLLADDVFFCLDTEEEAKERLLAFFMEHQLLPQTVWKVITGVLELEENKSEYKERFPEDYIEYVLNNSNYADNFNYELFEQHEQGLPYDDFIMSFYRFRTAVSEHKEKEAESILATIENMPLTHPYVSITKMHFMIMLDKMDEAEKISDAIYENYSDDPNCALSRASMLYHLGKYEEAYEINCSLEGIDGVDYSAKCGKADCLLGMERHREAQKIYKDLLMERHYDGYVHYKLTMCNEGLIDKYTGNIKANPKDDESRIELCWCFYQNNQIDKAYSVIENNTAEGILELDFCYLKARCLLGLQKEKKADSWFEKWSELYESYKNDESEIGKRNHDRKELVYYFRAEIALHAKDYNKALELNANALKYMRLDKDLIVTQQGIIYRKLGDIQKATEILQEALQIGFDNVQAMINLGDCYKETGRLQDAVNCYQRAIYTIPYLSEGYSRLIKLFVEEGLIETAEERIADFKECGQESDAIAYCEALIAREKDDYHRAATIIKELEQKDLSSSESDLFVCIDEDEYTYVKTEILSDTGDYELFEAIDIIKPLVRRNKDNVNYVYFLASLYKRHGEYKLAISNYKKALKLRPNNETIMIALSNAYREIKDEKELDVLNDLLKFNPDHPYAHGRVGEYYENRGMCESALVYYTKQLEIDPSDYFYISRGIMYLELCKNEQAIEDFNKAKDENSTNPYAYYNIGRTLLRMGQPKKAQKYLEKAVEVCGSEKRSIFYNLLAKCYCRQRENIELTAEKLRKLYDQMELAFPGDVLVWLNRGKALRSIGYTEEAIECFEKGLMLDKKDRYNLSNQIVLTVLDRYLDEKRAKEYISRFKKKVGIEKLADALYYAAHYFGNTEDEYKYAKMKESDNELELFELAIAAKKLAEIKKSQLSKKHLLEEYEEKMDRARMLSITNTKYGSDRLQGYRRMALIELDSGNYEKAEKYLGEAEKAPICDYCFCEECYELYIVRARIALAKNDRDKALEYAKRALELCPDDGEIRVLCQEIERM